MIALQWPPSYDDPYIQALLSLLSHTQNYIFGLQLILNVCRTIRSNTECLFVYIIFCCSALWIFQSLQFAALLCLSFVVTWFFLAQNPKRSLNKTCCLSKICLRECSVYASWEQHKPISNVNKRKANGKNWIDLLGALLASVFIRNICEQALSVYVVFIKYIFKKAATSKMLINYLFIHKHTGAKLWLHVNVYSIRIEAFF